MSGQLFHASNNVTLMCQDEILWILEKRVSSVDQFILAASKTGMMSSKAEKIPYRKINSVVANTAKDSVQFFFSHANGKDKKKTIEFANQEAAYHFGTHLGTDLSLNKTVATENQTKPILMHLMYLAFTIAGTLVFSMADLSDVGEHGSSRSRRNGALAKFVVELIGVTGVIIVGSLISLGILYSLYKRYRNPGTEDVYKR